MVQSLMSLLMLPASSYFATGGASRPRAEPGLRLRALLQTSTETSDGKYLAVAAIEPRFWENLMRALGLSHLAEPAGRDEARRGPGCEGR